MEVLTLGQKIKKLRKEKKMTLKELAGDRITAAQISHIERDKSYPSHDLLEYFARQLRVSIDYLLESKEMQIKKLSESLILKSEIHIRSKEYKEAKQDLKVIIETCEKHQVKSVCAKAKFLYGIINLKEKNYHEASNLIEESLILYVSTDNTIGVLDCYKELGKLYLQQNIYNVALDKFVQGQKYLKNKDYQDYDREFIFLTNIAYANVKMDRHDEGIKYSQKAKEIEEKIKDYKERGKNLLLMGSSYIQKQEYENAKHYLNRALEVFEKENKKDEEAKIYVKMSNIYHNMKNLKDALDYAKKAYKLKEDHEDAGFVKVIHNYIEVLISLKRYEHAIELAKKALSLSIKNRSKVLECNSLEMYSKVSKISGNNEMALECLLKALEIAKEFEDKKTRADIYFKIAKIYSGRSFEKEKEYYTKGIELYKELDIIR